MNIDTIISGLKLEDRLQVRNPYDDNPLFDDFALIGIALSFEQRLNRIHDSIAGLNLPMGARYAIGAQHTIEVCREEKVSELKIYDADGLVGHIVKTKMDSGTLPRAMTLVEYWWYGGRDNFETQYRNHMGRLAIFEKAYRTTIGVS